MVAMHCVHVLAVDSMGSRSGFFRSGIVRLDTMVASRCECGY